MKNINDNNLIQFTKISKKKEGLYANFKAKGVRGGTAFTAAISVDLSIAEVDPGDSLEKIIEVCAKIAERDLKKSQLQFEGIEAV